MSRPCPECKGKGGWMVAEYECGGACVGQHFDDCASCKGTGTAPLSRREEVEASIHRFSKWLRDAGTIEAFSRRHKDLALTLADEVDARDAIIDKLLAMLEPGGVPYKNGAPTDDQYEIEKWRIMRELHARACEIAGRVK